MYGQQSQLPPATKYFLDALGTGDVQLKTPDGADTVFAQKMQQGIAQGLPQMQGMQGAKQDYAAAAPSVARNAQEAQMRQALQLAMRPKPAGIEGLPSNIRMAEGGVVGYAGPDGSNVKLDVEQILKKAPAARTPEENAALRAAGVDVTSRQMGSESGIVSQLNRALSGPFIREAITGGALNLSDEELAKRSDAGAVTERMFRGLGGTKAAMGSTTESNIAPQAMRTEDAFASPRIDQPTRPTTPPAPPMSPEAQRMTDRQVSRGGPPAPRPPAQRPPAPAQTAPQGGIAELVAPTPESAMASARSVIGMPGTEGLRKREEAFLAALKAQPATGQQGLAALQAQQAALQAMNEKAEKESNINSAIQWLLGGREGAGGSARSSIAFSEREDARRRSYNDLQVANATKRDAIIDLQNARDVGNAKAALEAEQRIRAAEVDVAKAEATLAGQFASSNANVYGRQMQSRDAALNRDAQRKLEEYRRQTQLMKPKEQDMVSRLEALKLIELTGGKPETATPAQKVQALESAIRGSRGTGVEEKAEFANLRQRAKMIQDELKVRMEMDPSGKSPRVQQLQGQLDAIYKELGGTPTAAPTGGVVTPKSQAEFNALPKGARYINPADGKEYIKN